MIQFDTTVTLGNIFSLLGIIGVVGLYLLDTRYSPKGIHADVRAIRKEMARLAVDVAKHMEENDQRFDALRREFGETASALRTKITEVELFSRDNFVRRDSLKEILSQYQDSLSQMIDDLKDWMARIEARMDNAIRSPTMLK